MKELYFNFDFAGLPNSPSLTLTIFDTSVTLEDVKTAIINIIKENREAVTYVNLEDFEDENDIWLSDMKYSKLTDKEKALVTPEFQCLSTLEVGNILKRQKPHWFENPIEVIRTDDTISLSELWKETNL